MFLVQILLPVSSPLRDSGAVATTREELVERFGGVTAYSRAPAEGVWIAPDGDRAHDAVLMVEVLVETFDRVWWRNYQRTLAVRFRQEEIHLRALHAEVP